MYYSDYANHIINNCSVMCPECEQKREEASAAPSHQGFQDASAFGPNVGPPQPLLGDRPMPDSDRSFDGADYDS